jgi:hypothetical protein
MSTALAVSERVAVFCDHLIAGDLPEIAARLAGYEEPRRAAQALLAHPQVRKTLADAATGVLLSELVPLSLRVIRQVLEDNNPKAAGHRAKLAVAVYDRAVGHYALPGADGDPGQALAQLTTEQLAALVTRGLDASLVDVTPHETPAAGSGRG